MTEPGGEHTDKTYMHRAILDVKLINISHARDASVYGTKIVLI